MPFCAIAFLPFDPVRDGGFGYSWATVLDPFRRSLCSRSKAPRRTRPSGFCAGCNVSLSDTGAAEAIMGLITRSYRRADFDPVNAIWRRARIHALPDFHARKGHTAEEDRAYFKETILVKSVLWVAERSERTVGFMAIAGDVIDHLYVHLDHQQSGIGLALLDHAKHLSPSGLRLFTLQINVNARAFYEKHGFVVTRLGISPPPESEPDVEYQWTP